MTKINLNQIAIAYGAANITSITTATAAAWLYGHYNNGHTDYLGTITATWLIVVGLPSTIVARNTLTQKLGETIIPTITTTNHNPTTRAIPYTNNGQPGQIFLNAIKTIFNKNPGPGATPPPTPPTLPKTYTVTLPGSDNTPKTITLTHPQIETFIYTAHRRGTQKKAGLSRTYWTNTRQPTITRDHYDALITLLTAANLIADRGHRRSGRLITDPKTAIQAIQAL